MADCRRWLSSRMMREDLAAVTATQIIAMGRNTAIRIITNRRAPPDASKLPAGSSTRKNRAVSTSQRPLSTRATSSIVEIVPLLALL